MKNQDLINEITDHKKNFKNWLKANYSYDDIINEKYDDTGYPKWAEVENTFEKAFKELDFSKLKDEVLETIGYLLARQWDVGIIFPYFKEEISQIGMSENQLLILSKFGLKSNEWSFKQQCASSLRKVKNDIPKAIKIALNYFDDEDVDIKRHSLKSLHYLGLKNLSPLLEKAWKLNDELLKIVCLNLWKEINQAKFKEKLLEAKLDSREIIKKYINELKIE
ncbi:hypothetical protein [Aureispira sp. CCB-QB1]|uniref:hypothetical protein n=1 Tax=Aureispira sp. CCB-QB1 TaxID=1313421 RepID=UPI000698C550|nr:hypothetical protein [Aureispira sp. CCB-QB1]